MKIVVIGHSMVALRQQLFFQEVARLGHEVLLLGPGEWGNLRATNVEVNYPNGGSYRYQTCRHMGEDLYSFHFLGTREVVEEFRPDWLYVQQEPASVLAAEALQWEAGRHALFTWENIGLKDGARECLPDYDLVVCGNPAAEELVSPYNNKTALMLQVGVDCDHFASRDIPRTTNVGYAGRITPEKGLPYLMQAWPTARIAEWRPFKEMPWVFSEMKVLVSFSQDVPFWREQAPNYAVLEALACGCNVVISDTPAMFFWISDYPGVTVVPGHKQIGKDLDLVRIYALKEGIQKALENFQEGIGRQWVIDRFGKVAMARQLVEILTKQEKDDDS